LIGRCTGRCTGRGHGFTGRVRSVQRGASARVCDRTRVWPDQRVRSVQLSVREKRATGASGPSRDRSVRSGVQRKLSTIGREARPVTRDRTRPVVEGAYWTPTGRWHCRVRSLRGARPVVVSRARVLCGSARPVVARSASGRCFARAVLCDRRVRSF
jgi:hypothetical protein